MVRNICIGAVRDSHHGVAPMLCACWKVLDDRPTLAHGKSTGGRFRCPHKRILRGIDVSVPVVRIPGVEHFITTRSDAFVAHNFLNTSQRWLHLKYNTSVGHRTWPEKIERNACETKDDMMLLPSKKMLMSSLRQQESAVQGWETIILKDFLCICMVKSTHR